MTIEGISVFSRTPLRLEIEGARVTVVSDAPAGGRHLPYLSPGFVDLQVNGYRGIDYSSESLVPADVERIIRLLAASGTTKHVPTIITSPRERILRNLATLARARRSSPAVEAAIPGYHVEGPFISPEDGPRGAHSRVHVRQPSLEEFRAWQEAAGGDVQIVTVAPELPGALQFIEQVADTGVLVAIGHSAASPQTIRDAVAAGARLSTHLGNGSHAVLPRLSNYIWEQLAADELAAGMICDGFHLPPAVMKTFARTKGLARLFLVSDVAVNGGRAPGVYHWGDASVEVFADGHLGLHGTPYLAGAGHLLDWDIAHFLRASGVDLGAAVGLCTTTPRQLLGLPVSDFPSVGEEADLVLFDYRKGDEALHIRRTVQAGQLIYD